MHFNNSDNKFKIIAYGLSNDVEILAKEDFNGISIFNIRKQHKMLFSNVKNRNSIKIAFQLLFNCNSFSIALIFRCPNTQALAFIDCLNNVMRSGMIST